MDPFRDAPLISTIEERCRVCYTCVRECPAKAIRIKSGQAAVIEERCIGCGHCIEVCSQGAKQHRRCGDAVKRLLARRAPVAACLAPSFPAEFTDIPYRRLVGMIRRLGFASVHELAFAADLVAERYRALIEAGGEKRFIGSTCPAVVGYVERYHPDLVASLAPIVSPMIAMARCLKELHGPELEVVFVGPCIAKKREGLSRAMAGEVAAMITFVELRELFAEAGVTADAVEPRDFDPPRGGKGALFPIRRGLLEAARVDQGLASGEVDAVDGGAAMAEAIEAFGRGHVGSKLLEVLACQGCIMGPGMGAPASLFARRASVASYVRERLPTLDEPAWQADLARFDALDLGRSFKPFDQRLGGPSAGELAEILLRMGKAQPSDELNCGACGYPTCRAHARAIHAGLAESEMCLPYTIEHLRSAVSDLAVSHEQLATAQEALLHAEKLASMGQLAAGIAHEVNNPLGVVLMYAHLLLEQCSEESRMRPDLQLIAEQADRCKRIVAGLLNFARQNKLVVLEVDVRELVERAVKAVPAPPGVAVRAEHEGDPLAELDRDQMAQVLANLVANAYDAMPSGGTLTLRTSGDAARVRLEVSDTGVGVPGEHLSKIFEPFFTTKPIGKGTGLGLAVVYGIVKMHRGDLAVASNADPAKGPLGTTFTVTLPRRGAKP
jgi:two-component system NtrC family sensor kinase